ncbi:MAG: DUF59 domain-containing protein, partial [Acidothermales bacterium]|nr:DUF59 domain-containing protein [Acidothermales bacterium]
MRVDHERLREIVGGVDDPEIGLSLAELGMLDDVRVDRRGHAQVSVALTTPGCPLADALREKVVDAATRVEGVRTVDVAFTVMDERRRASVGRRLHETRTSLTGALGGG